MKLFLVGGFLGSGKTTAIEMACLELLNNHITPAVITNDQGTQLVDSAFIKRLGVATKEVVNGCFCCNYNDLDKHINTLVQEVQPQVIFAESVGSCADLVATIAKPFTQFHPEVATVISVFADAHLLHSLMSGQSCFLDEKVQYIYKKQLEEADLLVINKIDLLDNEELAEVKKIIAHDYYDKKVLYQDSLDTVSIQKWIEAMNKINTLTRNSLAIDYDIYAEGEAMLGWLDKQLVIETNLEDAVSVAATMIGEIQRRIKNAGYAIGHLKFLLDNGEQQVKISFTAASNDFDKNAIGLSNTNRLSMLINARVQAEPKILEDFVADSIAEAKKICDCSIVQLHAAYFKPGYPRPTHRIAE